MYKIQYQDLHGIEWKVTGDNYILPSEAESRAKHYWRVYGLRQGLVRSVRVVQQTTILTFHNEEDA